MKLRRDDTVVVITGRDKGKTGKVLNVIPTLGKVVVEGVNISKRHTKPSDKNPQGGILDLTKPIDVSKVMVLDPQSGKPSRISYKLTKDGSKERVFKPSRYEKPKKAEAKKSDAKKTDAKKADKKVKA